MELTEYFLTKTSIRHSHRAKKQIREDVSLGRECILLRDSAPYHQYSTHNHMPRRHTPQQRKGRGTHTNDSNVLPWPDRRKQSYTTGLVDERTPLLSGTLHTRHRIVRPRGQTSELSVSRVRWSGCTRNTVYLPNIHTLASSSARAQVHLKACGRRTRFEPGAPARSSLWTH